MSDSDADQDGAFAAPRALKQLQSATQSFDDGPFDNGPTDAGRFHSTMAGSVTSPSSPVGKRTLRAGTTVEIACL